MVEIGDYNRAMLLSDVLKFSIEDRIDDVDVMPSHVPLSLLGEFQRDVSEFLRGSSKDVDPAHVIISIEKGSLTFVAKGLMAAAGLWTDMSYLHDATGQAPIDPKRAEVLEKWQRLAHKTQDRKYVLADSSNRILIEVGAHTNFHAQGDSDWVPVEKYIEGVVMDMGGLNKPNIHLKVGSGPLLTIAATRDQLATEEKNLIYHSVQLRVSAEENLRTGDLRNYSLMSFDVADREWDEVAFKKMVEKGTQAWADVPDSWLEDLRNGQG